MFPADQRSPLYVMSRLTLVNLAPLSEVTKQSLLALILVRALVHLANVECAVGSIEGADATHVIAVLSVLLAPEAIPRVVDQLGRIRQAVEIAALGSTCQGVP